MANSHDIKRNVALVFSVNIVSMILSLIMNFTMPNFLSIETYSLIQTYNLYVSISGLLTFGFTDGIYLKYGGNDLSCIPRETLALDLSTFRIFQIFLIILLPIAFVYTGDPVCLAAGLSFFPLNMTSFFSLLFQATGDFERYSRITGLKSILLFLINMGLIFITKLCGYELSYSFIIGYLLLNIIYWLILEYDFVKLGNPFEPFLFKMSSLIENIKNGISLTLGTFTSVLFTSVDRWYIKVLLDTASFAYYSFAVSIDNFLNTAISPVTVTLYNYFCNNKEKYKVDTIRKCIVILASLMCSCGFVARNIILIFIPKYIPAINIIFFLLVGKELYTVVQAIYVNLYKVYKKQNLYFRRLIVVTIINILLNYVLYLVFRSSTAFAIGTLISNVVWFLLSAYDFKEYAPSIAEIAYILVTGTYFLFAGLYLNPIIGLITYLLFAFGVAYIVMRKDMTFLQKEVIHFFNSLVQKGKSHR